jgi:outer membrane protein TolC
MKHLTIVLLLTIIMAMPLKAEETEVIELDLETSVSLALENNLDIESEKLRFDKTRWAMITSWNKFIPTASLSSNLTRPNTVLSGVDLMTFQPIYSANDDNVWNLDASFSTSLSISAGKVFDVQKTVLDWKSGKIDLETAREKMKLDVTRMYYDLLIQQEELQIKIDELASAEERYQQTRTQYRNGLKSEYDMLSAQVQFENIKPTFIEYKNNFEVARIEFKDMLGLRNDAPIRVTGTVDRELERIYTMEDISTLQEKVNDRMDIRKNLITLRNKQLSRNKSIAAMTPSISLSYGTGAVFSGNAAEDTWFGDQDYMESNWAESQFAGFGTAGFTFSLSMPLDQFVPFSTKQMSLINSQYDIKIQKLSNQKSFDTARLEIKKLVMQLVKSRGSLESLELNVKLAKKAYDMAEEQYQAGNMDLLSVNNSESEWKKAKISLLKERKSYILGALDLEYALEIGSPGGGFSGGGAAFEIPGGFDMSGFDAGSLPPGIDLSSFGF